MVLAELHSGPDALRKSCEQPCVPVHDRWLLVDVELAGAVDRIAATFHTAAGPGRFGREVRRIAKPRPVDLFLKGLTPKYAGHFTARNRVLPPLHLGQVTSALLSLVLMTATSEAKRIPQAVCQYGSPTCGTRIVFSVRW